MGRWILLLAALSSFVVYGHALGHIFSKEYGIDGRMKALRLAGAISAVTNLAAIASSDAIGACRASAAFLCYCLAVSVFYAARRAKGAHALTLAFSSDEPAHLLRTGIYSRIRHPFYTAYILTWLAGVMAAPGLSTIAATSMMIAFYWNAASVEERKFAASRLGQEYAVYRQRAGRFWPLAGKKADTDQR